MNNDLVTWRQQMELNVISAVKNVSILAEGFGVLTREVEDIKKDLKKRIYLSNSQLIELRRLVKEKAAEICRHKGFKYNHAYRYIIQAIWRSINDQYNVPSYRELPEAYYCEIVEKVNLFNLPMVIEERIKKISLNIRRWRNR